MLLFEQDECNQVSSKHEITISTASVSDFPNKNRIKFEVIIL